MAWEVEKWKDEFPRFWKAWAGTLRGFKHDYVDFFVEMNRWMPYTKGHIEAIILVPLTLLWTGWTIWAIRQLYFGG